MALDSRRVTARRDLLRDGVRTRRLLRRPGALTAVVCRTSLGAPTRASSEPVLSGSSARRSTAGGGRPVLLFVYIDDGARSVAGFHTYLRHYARLLAVVPRWRLVHVSGARRQANAAAAAFRRAFGHDLAGPTDAGPSTTDAVRDYFHLRQAYEAQRWAALDTGKLDRFRALRLRFNTVLDPLYARWELHGDAVLEEVPASAREWPPRLRNDRAAALLRRPRAAEAPVMTRVHHGVSCHGPCDARSPWLSGTMSPRRDANVPRDSQMRRNGSSHATSKSMRAETGATPLRGETSSLTGVSTRWGRSCLGPHVNDTITPCASLVMCRHRWRCGAEGAKSCR